MNSLFQVHLLHSCRIKVGTLTWVSKNNNFTLIFLKMPFVIMNVLLLRDPLSPAIHVTDSVVILVYFIIHT